MWVRKLQRKEKELVAREAAVRENETVLGLGVLGDGGDGV